MNAAPGQGGLTLALNAAEDRLMLALGACAPESSPGPPETELFFAQEWQAKARGAELLVPALHHALTALGLAPDRIGRVAVVSGPGGFTGLRLTAVSAAALARGLRLRTAALPYLPLLAAAALASLDYRSGASLNLSGELAGPQRRLPRIWALVHARRGSILAQSFAAMRVDAGSLLPEALSPPLFLELEECAALLREQDAPALILGSGLSRNRDFFRASLDGKSPALPLPPEFDHPCPAFLLRCALHEPDSSYSRDDIRPMYMRPIMS
ncbi:MAG: tRNA (adenosine(37)-N6)-threonylcarbamoyltransferase complex dimerization subunit type 1 TsaB [Deltaproteobacteria bacterium]|nr:tRNA (adenosine(37)-N6)-threonylcarbamoyltransferase complex dimerization subunit type 1 TsaB [Deltaproteobacteria bacterium]